MSGIPFATTANVDLAYTAGFTESKAQFDTSKLINTLRVPVEVTEIRIMIEAKPLATVEGAPLIDLAPFIFLEGKFGKHYLTDGLVPVAVMSPYRLDADRKDVYPIEDSQQATVSVRRIVLTKPLYVPPGRGFMFTAQLPSSVFLDSFGWNFNAKVHIAIIGRFLGVGDPSPAMNHIPIISYVELTQTKRTSLEGDLQNPLSQPIRVHRFVGATPYRYDSAENPLSNYWNPSETTVEIKFPDASPASEDPIRFKRGLFSQMRVWPAKFDMPANSRIQVRISPNSDETTDPIVGHQIALFGTRPEVIP